MADVVREEERSPEQRRIAELEAQLAKATQTIARLRERYHNALEQLVLIQRRLVVAKSERRVDTSADQLAFDKMFAEVEALRSELAAVEGTGAGAGASTPGAITPPSPQPEGGDPGRKKERKKRETKPTGRRDLSKAPLPVVFVDVLDADLEETAERIGFEESQRLGYQRGGKVRVVMRLAVYKVAAEVAPTPRATPTCAFADARVRALACTVRLGGHCTSPSFFEAAPVVESVCAECAPRHTKRSGHVAFRIVSTPLPREIMRRGLLAPAMIAHVLAQKYLMGVPFNRLEEQYAFDGFSIDRAMMCRYAEHVGATLGQIVEVARAHFIATAFCLSTDATGVAVQPTPLEDGGRQPCRKGHFFVTLADRDHIFFDYQAKHDSRTVWQMFKGYSGYIQADASAVYNALFRGIPPDGIEESDEEKEKRGPPPKEVGCWSHMRRKFWEAAVCRHAVGLEGLRRINEVFDKDRTLKDLAPAQRKVSRELHVRPLVDDFFVWVKDAKKELTGRGLVATAIGYALNHEGAFRRFLEDGRLRIENNSSERALRPIATGRNAWLFFGSDDHASSAANLFSLIASCKLHGLDPEAYLADVIRVFPYWPRDRYLELVPKYWARTRARLVAAEMAFPVGPVTIPPPMAAEEQNAPR